MIPFKKIQFGLALIVIIILVSSCGTSPEEMETTSTAETIADTYTPIPSSTPTFTPSPIPPTSTPTITPYPPFRDDFNQELEDGWEWMFEIVDGWNLTDRPGFMQVVVPVNGKQYLLREAPAGDFQISTRVLYRPRENFLGAGLIILQDDNHYIRLHRGYAYFDNMECCIGNGIYYDQVDFDRGLPEKYYAVDLINPTKTDLIDEAYLRLSREGNTYTAYYSSDGENWTIIGKDEAHWIPVYVGIDTFGDQNTIPVNAGFDFFTIETVP